MSLSRTLRYAEWTRPFWWLVALCVAPVLTIVAWTTWLTSRVRTVGTGATHTGPAVYVNWHRHLPFTMFVNGRHHRWMMMLGAPYMASIAAWGRGMGLRLIRGATGSGGREALAALRQKLAAGDSVALAVDGPAGPGFQVKPGCVDLAREAGVPIIAVAYRSRRQHAVRGRWDQSLIVFPFDDITVLYGDPMMIDPAVSLDEALHRVEDALFKLDPHGSR